MPVDGAASSASASTVPASPVPASSVPARGLTALLADYWAYIPVQHAERLLEILGISVDTIHYEEIV